MGGRKVEITDYADGKGKRGYATARRAQREAGEFGESSKAGSATISRGEASGSVEQSCAEDFADYEWGTWVMR
jgi:hypothetical protein